jgi:hypothetical protein
VTIINEASSSVNELKASLNDAARGVIYERHMFIVQATGPRFAYSLPEKLKNIRKKFKVFKTTKILKS